MDFDAVPARSGVSVTGMVLLVLVVLSLLALGATWWWTLQSAAPTAEAPAAATIPENTSQAGTVPEDSPLWEETTPDAEPAPVAPPAPVSKPAPRTAPKSTAPKPAATVTTPAPAASTATDEIQEPVKRKKTVKEICQDKNIFSRPICESRYCEKPEYNGTPYCAEVRARRGGGSEIKN